MIYIDPPYNTGKDFVYNDDFAMSREEMDEAMGNVDKEGNRLRQNLDSNPRYHSDWCSMIYSRLLVARTLLSNDGVIFISIDDNEVHHLRKICDEVLGAGNFVAQFTRVTKKGGKSSVSTAKNHDYILAYTKQISTADLIGVTHYDEGYSLKDEHFETRGYYKLNQTLDYDSLGYVPSLDYPIVIDGEEFYAGGDKETYLQRQAGQHGRADWGWRWRWSKELYAFGYKNDFIVIKRGGQRPRLYTKTYQKVKIEHNTNGYKITEIKRTKPLSTLEFTENIYSNDNAKKKFDELMQQTVFEYTKPTSLISRIMQLISSKDALILDFFSGSASTAHAVMQLNAEDGGRRKYIMVQLPEKTAENSEARKAGYDTICEIGKERIRRAGKQVVGNLYKELVKHQTKFAKFAIGADVDKDPALWEHIEDEATRNEAQQAIEAIQQKIDRLDTGFRVLRVDSSNMEDVYFEPAQTTQENLFSESVKAKRSELDLLFGCMVDWGVELNYPLRKEKYDGKNLHIVNEGALVACFDKEINADVVTRIAELKPLRIIFREECFATDADKLNIYEKFKQLCGWSDDEVYKRIHVF